MLLSSLFEARIQISSKSVTATWKKPKRFFCHVMVWMVDCLDVVLFWSDYSPESDTLTRSGFLIIFDVFSSRTPPFQNNSQSPFVFMPPFDDCLWGYLDGEVSCDKCRNWVACLFGTCQHCLDSSIPWPGTFQRRGEVAERWTCLSPSWSIVWTSNRWSFLCVGLCCFGSEIEQSKIFGCFIFIFYLFLFFFPCFWLVGLFGAGLDLDLLLVVWRWFMANNLGNFILFYISGCLCFCGLNVMSTVLHVISNSRRGGRNIFGLGWWRWGNCCICHLATDHWVL